MNTTKHTTKLGRVLALAVAAGLAVIISIPVGMFTGWGPDFIKLTIGVASFALLIAIPVALLIPEKKE